MYKKLLANEYNRLEFVDPSEKHERYLNAVGFIKDGNVYRLNRR